MEYFNTPSCHLLFWACFLCSFSSGVQFLSISQSFLKPFSTHRNRSAAQNWVTEYLCSLSDIGQFECVIMAEGMRTVEPEGKVATSLRSHKISWPPFMQSKLPSAVIAHQPNARFRKSVCGRHWVLGPKLIVMHAQAPSGKFGTNLGSC